MIPSAHIPSSTSAQRHSLYRICQLVIDSNIPLPELARLTGTAPDCTFRLLARARSQSVDGAGWHHWHLPDGTIWCSCSRQGTDYRVHFPGLADFAVNSDGKEIRCRPVGETPRSTVRHLLLDHVVPFTLHRRGELVLHASAVAAAAGAIAFVGETGWGKSTLSATLTRQGCALLADDCLVVKERGQDVLAIPSYAGLRLWPDTIGAVFGPTPRCAGVAHYTKKKRLTPKNGTLPYGREPVGLQRIYLLAPPTSRKRIAIETISERDTFFELVRYAYRLDVDDRELSREEFKRIGRISSSGVVRRLSFPRDFSRLSEVRARILTDLDSTPSIHD